MKTKMYDNLYRTVGITLSVLKTYDNLLSTWMTMNRMNEVQPHELALDIVQQLLIEFLTWIFCQKILTLRGNK